MEECFLLRWSNFSNAIIVNLKLGEPIKLQMERKAVADG